MIRLQKGDRVELLRNVRVEYKDYKRGYDLPAGTRGTVVGFFDYLSSVETPVVKYDDLDAGEALTSYSEIRRLSMLELLAEAAQ